MEAHVETANAYSKTCLGCIRHNKDVMITFTYEGEKLSFHDFFLTNKQAQRLLERLTLALKYNTEESLTIKQ